MQDCLDDNKMLDDIVLIEGGPDEGPSAEDVLVESVPDKSPCTSPHMGRCIQEENSLEESGVGDGVPDEGLPVEGVPDEGIQTDDAPDDDVTNGGVSAEGAPAECASLEDVPAECVSGEDVPDKHPGKRKRGQRGSGKNSSRKRKASKYKPGTLFESSITPKRDKRIPIAPDGKKLRSDSSATGAGPKTIGDILRAIGLPDRVEHAYHHVPSLKDRQNPDTWHEKGNPAITFTESLMEEIVRRISLVFCGNVDESAKSILESFFSPQELRFDENDTKYHRLLEMMAECCAKSKRGSIERRTLRACLSYASRAEVKQLCGHVSGFTSSNDSFARGTQDLPTLSAGENLNAKHRTVQYYDKEEVEAAVGFILSPANVSFLLGGTKRLKLNDHMELFPAITRRRSITAMFEVSQQQSSDSTLLSRATFFRIAAALTSGDAKLRNAVDYVVGVLVNDSFNMITDISPSMDCGNEDVERLLRESEEVCAYLKYGFDNRVKNGIECRLHDIEFGLLEQKSQEDDDELPVCNDCRSVFRYFDRLKSTLTTVGAPPSAVSITSDCREKAKLSLGHRIQVINQQLAIQKLHDDMKESCLAQQESKEAVVTIDYKMKLDPIYYREKSLEHYGKKGTSRHGANVQFWEFEKQEASRGNGEPFISAQKVYFDHFSRDDSKQDKAAVISLVEAMLMRLKKDLPFIKRIAIQSDNAACYQTGFLPLLFPYLSSFHGIRIERFVHTETQDGKSILDAHFAKSMQLLLSWVKEGNNCVTPTQAVIGLKMQNGLPNCTVKSVDHDRDQLAVLLNAVSNMEADLRRQIARANDVQIEYHDVSDGSLEGSGYRRCPPFTLRMFEHSHIGKGAVIHCNPAQLRCHVEKEEECEGDENAAEIFPGYNSEHGEVSAEELSAAVGSDAEQENSSEEYNCTSDIEVVEAEINVEPATGVSIATEDQLRRRTRRWKKYQHLVTTPLSFRRTMRYRMLYGLRLNFSVLGLCLYRMRPENILSGLTRLRMMTNFLMSFLEAGRGVQREVRLTEADISVLFAMISKKCLREGEEINPASSDQG